MDFFSKASSAALEPAHYPFLIATGWSFPENEVDRTYSYLLSHLVPKLRMHVVVAVAVAPLSPALMCRHDI